MEAPTVGLVTGAVGGVLGFLVAFFTRRDEAKLAARGALFEQIAADVRAYAGALAALRAKVGEQCTALRDRRNEILSAIEHKRVELQGEVSTRSVPWLDGVNARGREQVVELNLRLEEAYKIAALSEPLRTEGFVQIENDLSVLSQWSNACFRAWFTALLGNPARLGETVDLPALPAKDLLIRRIDLPNDSPRR